MMLLDDFDACCAGLESVKVAERRKSAELLKDFLNKPFVVKSLNFNDRRRNWDLVYSAFHRFIKKEGEKLQQDEIKQVKNSTTTFKCQSFSDTFLMIVNKANCNEARLSANRLVESCIQCFESTYVKKYFGFVYLKVLIKHILPVSSYWGKISDVHWKDIYVILKDLHVHPDVNLDKESILRGLYLTVKFGSLHSTINILLQEEFEFIQSVCLDLTNNTNSIQQQINSLHLLLSYSELMSKDNRMATSKLGEEISRLLLDFLYHLRHEYHNGRKSLIFDYLLLQVRIHHPEGRTDDNDASYCYNSENWRRILRSLYSVLRNEIDVILRYYSTVKKHDNLPGLCANFLELFVAVAKQVFYFNCDALDITQTSIIAEFAEASQPLKKRRVEVGVSGLVSAIQCCDNWPWLSILAKLLELHPEIFEPHEFLTILETLASLQAECKDAVSRHYLYKALIGMVEAEKTQDLHFQNKEKLDLLWTRIWETSLRSIGLNQNEETTHKLIQIILKNKKNPQNTSLLSIFLSGVVNISQYSIDTLQVLCESINMPEILTSHPDSHPRKYLINFVLNTEKILLNNQACFQQNTSQTITSLVLKTPLITQKTQEIIPNNRKFKSIEEVYLLSAFENGLLCEKFKIPAENAAIVESSVLVHSLAFEELTAKINQLSGYLNELPITNKPEVIQLINGIALLMNLTSKLVDVKIIDETNISNFLSVTKMFESLSNGVKNLPKPDLLIVSKYLEDLLNLQLSGVVANLMRHEISVDFLKIFFELLNTEDTPDRCNDDMADDVQITEVNETCCISNESTLNLIEKLQLCALRILASYSCVNCEVMHKRQQQVLVPLLQPVFNPKIRVDFQMTVLLLKSLTKCNVGILDEATITFILNSLQTLFAAHYENFFIAIVLLRILRDAIPHINASQLTDAKSNLLILLNPFIDRKDFYGPELLIVVIESLGSILKIDLSGKWPEYKELTIKLINFLKSNYIEVRLNAIKNILNVFYLNSNKQENILGLLKQNINESFSVRDNLSNDQLIDEAANRVSSALHLYAGLIAASVIWRKYFLFEFFQLIFEKKINTGLIQKVLKIITNYLNISNTTVFLDENIDYLLTNWCKNNRNISEFPFRIFSCENSLDFYEKYVKFVAPILLLQGERNTLEIISDKIKRPIPDIIKMCYPFLIGQYLPIIVCEINDEISKSRRLFNEINKILNENESELLNEMFEDIFVQLLNRVYDSEHFEKKLNISEFLPKTESPSYNFEIFQKTLKYIESKISNSQKFILHYADKSPEKLEKILLEVTSNIHEKQTLEDKLLAMHRYSILIDLISIELTANHELNAFFIRSIVNNLISTIKINKNANELLKITSCRCLKKFAGKCLESSAKIFENFLILIVSTLTPIAKLATPLGVECLDVLKFLIVENSTKLYGVIGALDPFPKDRNFSEIQEVYEKIKYGNESFTLEREIRCFLNVGNNLGVCCDRTDGLKYLRDELSAKKHELNELYAKLEGLRGFCHNSDESILHQFICMLVELTMSPISQVKLEAARCLGELGPIDLTTLVLKPEKILINHDLDPLELFCIHVIVSLTKYIVNPDVKIAKNASAALYAVLGSKEGTNIIKSYNNEDYGCGLLEKPYILPFIRKKHTSTTNLKINSQFYKLIDDFELWCPLTQNSHQDWIITLVSQLLRIFPENTFLRELIPICQVNMEFAELLLPLIVFLILTLNNTNCTKILSKQIQQFFENHWKETAKINTRRRQSSSQTSIDSNNFVVFNRASVQCMLNTVHFIRLQQNIYQNSIVDELKLNYLHVALSAQYCSAYFTSVLYAELWCYTKLEEKEYDAKRARSILESVCENEDFELTLSVENMLREAYKKIGDTDAVHGCGTSYILNTRSRLDYYKNTGHWDKVVLYYNRQLTSEGTSNDLINALKITGLHNLALRAPSTTDDDLSAKYECAWRLNNWNFTNSNEVSTMAEEPHFERYHYAALKALHERDYSRMDEVIAHARASVINGLSHASLESSKSLYLPLTHLKMLHDVESYACAKQNGVLEELITFWQNNHASQNDFEYVEPIRAQRITLLVDEEELEKKYLVDMYLQMAEESREVNATNIAQQALDCVSSIENLTEHMRGRMLYEQAQLSWLDDKTSGRYLLKYILENNEHVIPLELYGRALTLYGNWMVETRSENPTTIIENYFQKSFTIFEEVGVQQGNLTAKCDALNSLARFADVQYQQVTTYIASSSFESKLEIMKKSRDMAIKIQHERNTSDERRAIALHEKQSLIDESEVNNAYQEKDMYLTLAVKNYLRILKLSDTFNLKVFRILSLSLDNKQNHQLLNVLKQVLPTIATYKFIPLLPQLVPHIAGQSPNQTELFENIIHELLERCAHDHPHHTLPIILAVSDSYKDRNYDRNAREDGLEARVQIAKDLLTKLKGDKAALTQIIVNMEQVSTALVSLAYVDASKCSKRGNGCLIPRNESIKSIRNFSNVLVPTLQLEVRKNKNYNRIIGISEFGGTFSVPGGVNAPKKISCRGTDGIERAQLVKGKDDLRQDAVMQQVFGIINELLAKDKQTNQLAIRRYKVVPLSQRSGVLEWCENTEPLGSYLNDAHRRYRPSDWTTAECRNRLRLVHAKDLATKLRTYEMVCSRLRPVMHMFFVGAYPQTTLWFERRRAYVRSVATTSMAGYVLGLGDRHVHNILLDTTTAELVHIDFGIAFEQGKCLPTPETVPFRLTRDIEAGMGVCGIDGVFRRSCEHTMQVLRQNSETILTILQVLLYDPLYVWTITPAEAYSRQKDDDDKSIDFTQDSNSSSINITAERALLRLKEKLQGMEGGAICSVEGQVEVLLQQARDPVNLSRLFNGWQPYL